MIDPRRNLFGVDNYKISENTSEKYGEGVGDALDPVTMNRGSVRVMALKECGSKLKVEPSRPGSLVKNLWGSSSYIVKPR